MLSILQCITRSSLVSLRGRKLIDIQVRSQEVLRAGEVSTN